MFKKVVVVVLAIVFLAGVSFAQEAKEILTYTVENTSGTEYLTTYVPITSIYPDSMDMIIGFTILPKVDDENDTGNSELLAMLYDATSTTGISPANTIELIGEAEATNELTATMWFPYPRTIKYGVAVKQGMKTVVVIYFIRG